MCEEGAGRDAGCHPLPPGSLGPPVYIFTEPVDAPAVLLQKHQYWVPQPKTLVVSLKE